MVQLTESLKIKGITFNNRLVMPPMATEKSLAEGKVSDALCKFYTDRAAGGYIGLVITEHSYISKQGKASKGLLSISSDDDIEGLKKLVKSARLDGTKVIAQINHAGSATKIEVTGMETVAPSAIISPRFEGKVENLPRTLTHEDIAQITRDFTQAAVRSKEAGFDGVQIHSAHGYLLNQFYSPLTNQRTDEYGADTIENRLRIHLEIITAVRQAVGEDFIISLRLGACDYVEGGTTLEDSLKAAKLFEEAGIDLLDISGGMYGYQKNPNNDVQGFFKEITKALKEVTSMPVILTGGITDAKHAKILLEEDAADLIGVGRALIKEPRWAEKALA